MDSDFYTVPRLYTEQDLAPGGTLALSEAQAHYLRTVLRRQPGENFRIFNGRDGEFLVEIVQLDKKKGEGRLKTRIRLQPPATAPVHLLFAPLKKDRLDFLIEKAVELGATDLHPVITERTEVRKLNEQRIAAQIMEAAEQCERMEMPRLHAPAPLLPKLSAWPGPAICWGLERTGPPLLSSIAPPPKGEGWAFLIGPVGGFSDAEIAQIQKYEKVKAISLGERVLRAETACLVCLSHVQLLS